MESFGFVHIVLSVYCLVACLVNHIDDTDETYGYFEPLHFLLYGNGMQTWEYSPEFAIRTYAFVLPLWPWGRLLGWLGYSKITVFFGIKLILGQGFSWAAARYLCSLRRLCGREVQLLATVLMLSAPGVFFSATSFLPSAACSSFVMAALASWADCGHPRRDLSGYFVAIFFGCLAVVVTGWPFVAVVFAPIGVHMVTSCFLAPAGEVNEGEADKGGRVCRSGWHALGLLLAGGAGILLLTVTCVCAVDSALYGQLTFPPLNIALYNALNGSGDQLYGVEPTSYYLKNLLLMVGLVAAPLAAVSPAALLARLLALGGRGAHVEGKVWTLCIATFVWVLLLLSRPHKEERFMYPVYPLMCSLAAMALETAAHILERACACRSDVTSTPSSREGEGVARGKSYGVLPRVLALLVCGLAAALGASRVFASYRNYGGYLKLWSEVHAIVSRDIRVSDKAQSGTTVCMGGEWYTFPSHFFLPTGAELAFVEDGFGGLLPQSYVETWAAPPQPMNDRNQEEPLRYVPLDACDFFVLSAPSSENDTCDGPASPLLALASSQRVSRLHCEPLINAERSTSALFRAFAVPHFSAGRNHFVDYCVFKKSDRQPDQRP